MDYTLKSANQRVLTPVFAKPEKFVVYHQDENKDYCNNNNNNFLNNNNVSPKLINISSGSVSEKLIINTEENPSRKKKRQQKTYPELVKRRAIELFSRGVSKSEISRQLEVPESTSRGWIKAHEDEGNHRKSLNNSDASHNSSANNSENLVEIEVSELEDDESSRRTKFFKERRPKKILRNKDEVEAINVLLSMREKDVQFSKTLTFSFVDTTPGKGNKVYAIASPLFSRSVLAPLNKKSP